jgi:hypothetical protein
MPKLAKPLQAMTLILTPHLGMAHRRVTQVRTRRLNSVVKAAAVKSGKCAYWHGAPPRHAGENATLELGSKGSSSKVSKVRILAWRTVASRR